MDPDHVSNAPVTTVLPVGEPLIPDEKPWGRSGPAPEDAETAPFMRAKPPPGSPMANWRHPAPEAEPVEGEPGMFWHKDLKGKVGETRPGHDGKWKKLPIGVTRSGRAYERPVSPTELGNLGDFAKARGKKGPRGPHPGTAADNTDIALNKLQLGGATPAEARAILARWNQKNHDRGGLSESARAKDVDIQEQRMRELAGLPTSTRRLAEVTMNPNLPNFGLEFPNRGNTVSRPYSGSPDPGELPTLASSPAQKEQNELEDLARMAAAAQEETASNRAYLDLASEKSGREVTNEDPLTPGDLRQMIGTMSLEDRLRLTNTINISLGRSTLQGPGSLEDAIAQTKAMFTDPELQQRQLDYVATKKAKEAKMAAETDAVAAVIGHLKNRSPEKYGALPTLDQASAEEIEQLMRDIPAAEPELYRTAYNRSYIKNG